MSQKHFSIFKRLITLLTVVFICVMCDQTTKGAATKHLATKEEPVVHFDGKLRLMYMKNDAGMLGSGTEMQSHMKHWVFVYGVGSFLFLLSLYALSTRHYGAIEVTALSLMIGGGSSNLIDRFLHDGMVIDFLNLRVSGIEHAVFNYADVAILIGVSFFILSSLERRLKKIPLFTSSTR